MWVLWQIKYKHAVCDGQSIVIGFGIVSALLWYTQTSGANGWEREWKSKEEKSQSGTLAKKTCDCRNMHGMENKSEMESKCGFSNQQSRARRKIIKIPKKKRVSRATLFFKHPYRANSLTRSHPSRNSFVAYHKVVIACIATVCRMLCMKSHAEKAVHNIPFHISYCSVFPPATPNRSIAPSPAHIHPVPETFHRILNYMYKRTLFCMATEMIIMIIRRNGKTE